VLHLTSLPARDAKGQLFGREAGLLCAVRWVAVHLLMPACLTPGGENWSP